MDCLMYKRILVPLENSSTDAAILEHIRALATFCKASVVLIHVADGFVARNFRQLTLRESEEMRNDREYIEKCATELARGGLEAEPVLAAGDPGEEIAAAAEREECDLIAMSTHGHRFLGDLLFGSVADSVRHRSPVPVLCVRARVPQRVFTPPWVAAQ
jgi:nucleotide-binding universal stress UspA family protein